MKKFLSLTLALLLILSMTATAFAADVTYGATDSREVTGQIKKTYTVPANSGITAINETLTFTSKYSESNPDVVVDDDGEVIGSPANLIVNNLAVNSLTLDSDTGKYNAGTVDFTVPALSKAGTYEWVITENNGNTAGVTYTDSEIHVIVYVGYDNESDTKKLAILNTESYIKKVGDSAKSDTFNNTLKLGSFTVEKDVQGDMANVNDEFEISVTLTSTNPIGTSISVAGTTVAPSNWTTNFEEDGTTVKNYTYISKLKYSENSGSKTFSNIPEGVVVTVSETETDMKGYTKDGVVTRKTVTGQDGNTEQDSTFTSLTITGTTNERIVVKNEKNAVINTGVSLDTVPYFLMLAVACVGMFLLLSKKRAYREN